MAAQLFLKSFSSQTALKNFFACGAVEVQEIRVPIKDVDSPNLENFKNRKEVYLFSRVHNCRPVEGRESAKWYFSDVLFTGWTQRKLVIR